MEKHSVHPSVEGKDIVIRVSIDDLVFIVENDPEYKYKVHDKKAFAKAVVFQLQNSKSFCNNDGINAIEELFQNAYEAVYEDGEESIITGESHFED